MGLLTILKKMKQKEKEVRLLMLYPLRICMQICFLFRSANRMTNSFEEIQT